MKERRAIVNVEGVIVDQGRFLMITRGDQEEHAAGTLSVPGGKVAAVTGLDDVLETTLRREILEEVGLDVGDEIAYVRSTFFISDTGSPVVDVVFLCRYRGGTPLAGDPGEIASISWMTAEEVLQQPATPPWTRRTIEMAEQKRTELGW